MNSKIRAIARRIKEHKTIVIARHIGPDPDAVASQVAFRDAIKLRYPSKEVYAVGSPVAKFRYLGKLDKLPESTNLEDALLIVLDCPNVSRIDEADVTKFDEVIKIDHHPFEDKMGDIEWIEPERSSTCEMITEFLISARYRANKGIAEKLFLGVVSDSERFLFDTTTYKTFELMAILLKNSKINLGEIYPKLYVRPINEVQFESYIMEHLKVTKNGFAYLKITKSAIEKYGVDAGTASNLVNHLNNVKEYLAWALVSYDEKQELYKVNIRSRGPVINDVASKYSGGGHALAAGARIKTMDEVDKLIKALDDACAKYKTSSKFNSSIYEEIKEEIKEEKKDEFSETKTIKIDEIQKELARIKEEEKTKPKKKTTTKKKIVKSKKKTKTKK